MSDVSVMMKEEEAISGEKRSRRKQKKTSKTWQPQAPTELGLSGMGLGIATDGNDGAASRTSAVPRAIVFIAGGSSHSFFAVPLLTPPPPPNLVVAA